MPKTAAVIKPQTIGLWSVATSCADRLPVPTIAAKQTAAESLPASARQQQERHVIGKLKGIVDSTGDDWVVIDVGGVGYVAHCAARTLQRLPAAGEAATLFIETYVREDMIRLYGFVSDIEREWFRLLMTVQGVGAKVALAVLSVLDPGQLATAIALKDLAAVSRAPGVGKRVAERIVTELKDKAPAYADADPVALNLAVDVAEARRGGAAAEAISALVNLGYPQIQAAAAVAAALKAAGEGAKTEVLIRQGLKELAR